MSDYNRRLLIKYGTFTLFLIIGVIMSFVGLLNGGGNKEGAPIFNMIFISGFLLCGTSILFMFISLTEDF